MRIFLLALTGFALWGPRQLRITAAARPPSTQLHRTALRAVGQPCPLAEIPRCENMEKPNRIEFRVIGDSQIHVDVFEAGSIDSDSSPPAIVYFFRRQGNVQLHYAKCMYLSSRGTTCMCAGPMPPHDYRGPEFRSKSHSQLKLSGLRELI